MSLVTGAPGRLEDAADRLLNRGYKPDEVKRPVDMIVYDLTTTTIHTKLTEAHLRFQDSRPYSWEGPIVPGRGQPGADLMIVTHMPSEDDMDNGVALTGEAGLLLELILNKAKLTRYATWRTSFHKSRPPQGAKITQDDVEMSITQFVHEVTVSKPQAILVMGQQTIREMLAMPEFDLQADRGNPLNLYGLMPVIPTVSLDFILSTKNPAEAKRMFWEDLHIAARAAQVLQAAS